MHGAGLADQKISGFGKEDETGYDQGCLAYSPAYQEGSFEPVGYEMDFRMGVSFLLLSFSWIPGNRYPDRAD